MFNVMTHLKVENVQNFQFYSCESQPRFTALFILLFYLYRMVQRKYYIITFVVLVTKVMFCLLETLPVLLKTEVDPHHGTILLLPCKKIAMRYSTISVCPSVQTCFCQHLLLDL